MPLGRQPVDRWTMNHWQVPYETGALRALWAGRPAAWCQAQVEPWARPPRCAWCPTAKSLRGDGVDVVPVRVEAIDAQGRAHPLANHMVQFRIGAARSSAWAMVTPATAEPEKGDRRSLFNGLAQVIVRSNAGSTGELKLTASTDGLQAASVSLALTPPPRPPAGDRHQPAGAAVVAARAAANRRQTRNSNPHRRT